MQSTEAMAEALVDAAWCRSCEYNQRGLCLYCRNDGADDTLEEARLDELNRKAEARAQARRCREAEQRAAVAEQRAKQAQQDADRKVAMLVLATAAMACMILGVCVMRASAWIGAGLLGAAALVVRWIPAS